MEWGAIERYSEADRVLWGLINREDIPTPEYTFWDNEIQYNQDEYKSNTCTMYQAFWAWSDLTGEEISLEDRRNMIDLAIEQGLDVSVGWYVHRAVKLVADYMWEVSYVRVPVDSFDYYRALDMWFSLMEWYKGNREYISDRDNNWVVEINDWWDSTYWHARRASWVDSRIDNYLGRDTNIYKLPELDTKIDSWNIFTYAYFYFDKIEMPPITNLPPHISPDDVASPQRREIVIARENEGSQRLRDWNELNYSVYTADTPIDETDAITRMIVDLYMIRNS